LSIWRFKPRRPYTLIKRKTEQLEVLNREEQDELPDGCLLIFEDHVEDSEDRLAQIVPEELQAALLLFRQGALLA